MGILTKTTPVLALAKANEKAEKLNKVFIGMAVSYEDLNKEIDGHVDSINDQIDQLQHAVTAAVATKGKNSKIANKIYSFLND